MKISRRQFLAASSLAGVSAWGGFASPRAFGANERLRLGIIGCGGIVREHIDSLLPMLAEENIEIATLCDVYDRRARQYAKLIEEKQAAPTQVGDYRRVLEDPNIDYGSLVSALKASGVTFEICEITLRNRKLKKEQFNMDATFTPSGVVRIGRLQSRENFAYIKP